MFFYAAVFVELFQAIDLFENGFSIGDELFALSGEGHAARGARKNRNIQAGFEVFNGTREIWLCDMEGFGGSVDGAGFKNFDSIFQV